MVVRTQARFTATIVDGIMNCFFLLKRPEGSYSDLWHTCVSYIKVMCLHFCGSTKVHVLKPYPV